jgi:excisionase family DNA binding protein
MESFLYTVQEAAETLKMSRSKVYGLIKEGGLNSVKIGGSRRLRKQDITQFVESLGTTHETQYQDMKGI